VAFELGGNLWIAAVGQLSMFKKNAGVYAVPFTGPGRGVLRQFLSSVGGGIIAGLTFTPNNHTLFCSVQHAGEDCSLDDSSNTRPDRPVPPRPSVIVVEKTDGNRVIGS
jgi:hypothetical protein